MARTAVKTKPKTSDRGRLPDAVAAAAAGDAAKPLSKDQLEKVRNKARELRSLEVEIEDLQQQLKGKNEQKNKIEGKELPEMFAELKIKRIDLEAEGNFQEASFEAKPWYSANIRADWEPEQQEKAYKYLTDQKAGDLIKTTLKIEFGMGERGAAKKTAALLKKAKIEFDTKFGVHAGSLAAWLKDCVENQNFTPNLELIGGTVGTIVKMKQKKEKK